MEDIVCTACSGSGWNMENIRKGVNISAPINTSGGLKALQERVRDVLLCKACEGKGWITPEESMLKKICEMAKDGSIRTPDGKAIIRRFGQEIYREGGHDAMVAFYYKIVEAQRNGETRKGEYETEDDFHPAEISYIWDRIGTWRC